MAALTFAVSLLGTPFLRPAPGRLPPLLRGGDGFASLFFKAAAGCCWRLRFRVHGPFSFLTTAMLRILIASIRSLRRVIRGNPPE